MITSLISQFMSMAGQAMGLAKPIVEEHLAQRYESESKEQFNEWQNILATPNEDTRAERMHGFIVRLCNDAGTPTGGLSSNVSIPVSHLHALVSIAIENVKQDKLLASAVYSLKQ